MLSVRKAEVYPTESPVSPVYLDWSEYNGFHEWAFVAGVTRLGGLKLKKNLRDFIKNPLDFSSFFSYPSFISSVVS